MYKDLLAQIVKYLHPKVEHHLFLELRRVYGCRDNFIFAQYYLVDRLNNKIMMKYEISNLMKYIPTIGCDIFGNYLVLNFIFAIAEYIRPFIFIDLANLKLMVVKRLDGEWFDFYVDVYKYMTLRLIDNLEKYNSNCLEYGFIDFKVDSFEINKKSIDSIRKGLEVFAKISKFQNLNDINSNLAEIERKYVKIYD